MTATNHALSGALIGLVVTQPVLALPLAFISHFVLDAIPHFGLDDFGGHLKAKKKFHRILCVDAVLLSLVIIFLIANGASWLVFACLFLAGSPDLIWAYRYVIKEKFGKVPPSPKNAFDRFHSNIQTSQTLQGIYVEAPLGLLLFVLIAQNL